MLASLLLFVTSKISFAGSLNPFPLFLLKQKVISAIDLVTACTNCTYDSIITSAQAIISFAKEERERGSKAIALQWNLHSLVGWTFFAFCLRDDLRSDVKNLKLEKSKSYYFQFQSP